MNGILKDQFNLLSKINFKRLINLIKLTLSYEYSRFLKRPGIWGKPYSIAFEPTTACNLKCPECPSGLRKFTRPIGNADFQLFIKTIDQVKKHAFYLTLYFQGEPLINPDFFKMVEEAKRKKFYVATSSNAHFFNKKNAESTVKSGLDRLIISLDGLTQKTYSKYRVEGELKTVLSGIENLVEAKRKRKSHTPYIIIQFLAFSHNEHEIEEVKKLKKQLGVDEVKIKSAQFYEPDSSDLIPENETLTRYRKSDTGKYEIKNNMVNHCWRLWTSPVITQDGQVLPCCFDKDAEHALGDLKTDAFKNIWNDKSYQGFRKQVFTDRSKIDICRNCSEGSKVWW
jgi:radical SAM protein with 4Fe4S-binding SPASM domain